MSSATSRRSSRPSPRSSTRPSPRCPDTNSSPPSDPRQAIPIFNLSKIQEQRATRHVFLSPHVSTLSRKSRTQIIKRGAFQNSEKTDPRAAFAIFLPDPKTEKSMIASLKTAENVIELEICQKEKATLYFYYIVSFKFTFFFASKEKCPSFFNLNVPQSLASPVENGLLDP